MKNDVRFYTLMAFSFLLILIASCKKDNSTPSIEKGTVTDIDGNVYNTVKIGNQKWMAENLKTTKYRNGELIGTTTPATLDIMHESEPKYQWAYNGDESNVSTYGRLYTHYTVMDSRNVCPIGWHIPTDAEWMTLTSYLGGEKFAGGKLKEKGTAHWNSPNTGATNEFGFTALPGGQRRPDYGTFSNIKLGGIWWSCSTYSLSTAWTRIMFYSRDSLYTNETEKSIGCSVRCVKD